MKLSSFAAAKDSSGSEQEIIVQAREGAKYTRLKMNLPFIDRIESTMYELIRKSKYKIGG